MNDTPHIMLSDVEVRMAVEVAISRRQSSMHQALKPAHGIRPDFEWEWEVQSAAAEAAVAKLLHVWWGGNVNSFKDPDLEGNLQVRWTRDHAGHLVLRPKDNPKHKYILVTGAIPRFRIQGWAYGGAVMQPEHLCKPDPTRPSCWFMPHSQLAPVTKEALGV